MKKRILSAVLVSGVTLGTATVNVNADDFDSQIAAKDAVISNLTNEQAAAKNQVVAIQNQVSTLQAQQSALESENARLEAVSQQLSDEIQVLSAKIVARNEAIKKQARNAQKQSGTSYLGSILNSKSVSEAITRLVAINKVVSANEKLLQQQENDKSALESKQMENQEAIKTVTANKAAIEDNKNALATQQAQLEAAQLELSAQLTTAQNEKANLQAQKAAAEEAARKAAEAEAAARAKAEAEAKAQAEAAAKAQEAIAAQQAQTSQADSVATSEAASQAPAQSEVATSETQSTVQNASVATSEAASQAPVQSEAPAKPQPAATPKPAAAKPAATQAQTVSSTNTAGRWGTNPNTYAAGNCTWYVKSVFGSKVGDYWGNGGDWAASAAAAGIATGSTPQVGAIVSIAPGYHGSTVPYGHVAIVSEVSGNKIRLSEMNVKGYNVVSHDRWVTLDGCRFIYVS